MQYIELDDKTIAATRALLVQRLRTLVVLEKKYNDKRVTRNWRQSELAVAKGTLIMERETIQALQTALQKPLALSDALGTGETGEGLIQVARNAVAAERQLASVAGLCERIRELDNDQLAEIQAAVTAALQANEDDANGMESHVALKGAGLL